MKQHFIFPALLWIFLFTVEAQAQVRAAERLPAAWRALRLVIPALARRAESWVRATMQDQAH